MTIRSNPPGAVVYIDDQEIGTTPVATDFTYYGTRRIRLARGGYESADQLHEVKPPWYQVPPIDFFSENVWPWELRDERFIDFELQPQKVLPRQELIDRADLFRDSAQQGYVIPGRP